MATPAEMRALATTLEEIAPHVETDYGPGQVATYGLAWEALRSAAGEIERLRASYELAEEAALFLLRTGSWIRQEYRDRALTMLDRARAGRSDSAPPGND